MRGEKKDHLIATEMKDGKCSRVKSRGKWTEGRVQWLHKAKVTEMLKTKEKAVGEHDRL